MKKKEVSLVLPNIRSCHNVGAMFRTADACGFTKLYLVGYTPHPPRPEIDKVSLGAEQWMPWEHREDLLELIKELRHKKILVVALEKTESSASLQKNRFTSPLALIVGNEVTGVGEEALALCDQVIHIPMYGRKESLNVSIAAGIGMYEIKKKLMAGS